MITAPKGGPLPVLLTSEWHNHQTRKQTDPTKLIKIIKNAFCEFD